MKTLIIGTGLTGLVGSRLVNILRSEFEFTNLSLSQGTDIRDSESVYSALKNSAAEYVLHLAAKTNVDACEKDKPLGKSGEAWMVNVVGTQNIADSCRKLGKHLIYVSTVFVFPGTGTASENTPPAPVNWYGETKLAGEKCVLENPENIILRISYPYGGDPGPKSDFVCTLSGRLRQNQTVNAVTDQEFTPTYIDDLALLLKAAIRNGGNGIYHAVGSQSLTVFNAVKQIAQVFDLNPDLIIPVTAENYYHNKAPRPLKINVTSDRIGKFGVRFRSFSEGLSDFRNRKGDL